MESDCKHWVSFIRNKHDNKASGDQAETHGGSPFFLLDFWLSAQSNPGHLPTALLLYFLATVSTPSL